jgi:hypothetical protein
MPPVKVLHISAKGPDASELLYESARLTFTSLPSLEALRFASGEVEDIVPLKRQRPGRFYLGEQRLTNIMKTEGSQREVRLVWSGSRKEQIKSVTITFVCKQTPNGSTHAAGEIISRILQFNGDGEITLEFHDAYGQKWTKPPHEYPGPMHPELLHAKWDDVWRAANWEIYLQTL